MKILITGGNNAKALKLMKAFPSHFVLLADYGDVPAIVTENYAFSSLGLLNKDSIAHILLNFCITEAIDCIIPLHEYEVLPLAKSAVLFGEYGIQVLLPNADVITDYLTTENITRQHFAVFIHGDWIFSTEERLVPVNASSNLNGVFGFNNADDLKLFTI
ncbi:hypothetical protein [Pedobacter sp. D749]|uniref:hypothetical protein n=1 Tax=Pedobacter sp. D749 TaxID=2856523 RepID=UPI001C566715|nr:hypothetical protein [Pedobacter sp. D749]QXU42769.1 hypothetical protein KYH19_03985 [Pedobacter sp. D749]